MPVRSHRGVILLICLFLSVAANGVAVTEAATTTTSATGTQVYVVPIKGEVGMAMYHHIRRALEEAEKAGAALVMLDMDTPGGRVDAARLISEALLEAELPTGTFVNPEAISAGSLIAISTKKIVTSSNGRMGCSAPIVMGPGSGGMEEGSEKIVSYVRALFEAAAEKNGYPVQLALAMVDKDLEVRNASGEVISATGKLLTLVGAGIVDEGFAQGVAETREQAATLMGIPDAQFVEVRRDFAEWLAALLASSVFSSILLMIGLAALYLEFQAPGIGIPALVAVIAFSLLFWSQSVAHLTGWEVYILLGIGFILLGLEIFVIPGFGLTGISGIFLILLSLVLVLIEHPVPLPYFRENTFFVWQDVVGAVSVVGAGLAGAAALIAVLVLILPRTSLVRNEVVLRASEEATQGYVSMPMDRTELIGREGLTQGTLRPAGVVEIDGERIDVVTAGEWIPAGSKVRVVRQEGRRIIVDPCKEDPT